MNTASTVTISEIARFRGFTKDDALPEIRLAQEALEAEARASGGGVWCPEDCVGSVPDVLPEREATLIKMKALLHAFGIPWDMGVAPAVLDYINGCLIVTREYAPKATGSLATVASDEPMPF